MDAERVLVGDVLPDAPARAATIDLGEAPPPGGTRTFIREDIWRRLRENGVDVSTVSVPPQVRVKSARVLLMPMEFAERVRGLVEKNLKPGVRLRHLEVRSPVKMSPSASLDSVVIPPLPRRVGPHRTTAMVDIVRNGKVEQRTPVTLELLIMPEGAEPTLRRGGRVGLIITKANATVSTEAVALQDGGVGEVISFRVERTKKTLRGRIDSPTTASVVSQ